MGMKIIRHAGQEIRVGEALIRVSRVTKDRTVTLYIEAPPSVRIEIVKPPEAKPEEPRR